MPLSTLALVGPIPASCSLASETPLMHITCSSYPLTSTTIAVTQTGNASVVVAQTAASVAEPIIVI